MATGSPTGRRTQQERRDRARGALLHAAAELVVECGTRALTLAAVGTRAGYSRGLVTHHFGTKQALVDELAIATQNALVAEVPGRPPGVERLLALVESYLGAVGRLDTRGRAFLVLWAAAGTQPELADVFRERDEAFRARVRADVRTGIEEGTVRADADPDVVAVSVVGQLRGIGLQLMLDPRVVLPRHLGRHAADQWRHALTSPGSNAKSGRSG